eukprot:5117416-Alexandrium_andersonii.AAC.1
MVVQLLQLDRPIPTKGLLEVSVDGPFSSQAGEITQWALKVARPRLRAAIAQVAQVREMRRG